MTALYIGQCFTHRHPVKVAEADTHGYEWSSARYAPCKCGSEAQVAPMDVAKTATRCGARCQNSVNVKCHCECAGENHGQNRLSFA